MKKLSLLICFALCTILSSPLVATDEQEIRVHLAAAPATEYLQQDNHSLEVADSIFQNSPGRLKFQKMINGIPLHGGFVTIEIGKKGRVESVFDDASNNIVVGSDQPKLNLELAKRVVERRLGNVSVANHSVKRVWFRVDDTATIAWEVQSNLTESKARVSPTEIISVVDGNTGAILSQSQYDGHEYYNEQGVGVYPRIVINDAIGAVGSRQYAADFGAVVRVDFGCTGVLISPNTVLCARHCQAGSGSVIEFGPNANNPVFTTTVQSSFLPAGGGSLLDGGDCAILRLNADVPLGIATPMRLIDATSDLEGMRCSLVGYGANGVGSSGHNGTSDNRRWGGENVIDRYGNPADGGGGSNIISTDFDNGSANANTISGSSSSPVEFEATTAPGDSGGPVMVQINDEWLVAGVLSGGTTFNSVYGDISWWTGTAIYRTEIEERGGEFFSDDAILGDVNCDGAVNLLDVAPFIDLLSSGGYSTKADINQDGTLNLLDVNPFASLLSGG